MDFKDTLFSAKQTLNCNGRLLDLSTPRVMGILNITPDSFYDGGRYEREEEIMDRATSLLEAGADILDIGACSSRPGADEIPVDLEKERLIKALVPIRRSFPDAILSVDTCQASIAEFVVKEYGVSILNDITAGLGDEAMLPLVGSLKVPYLMMHMQGRPETMQVNPTYDDITRELLVFFGDRIALARQCGIEDIVVDPGFGFGKTLAHNYTLLRELDLLSMLGCPIMVGFSRKSMIYKVLQCSPEDALNGTTVLNTLALGKGARLLRVHDVREAVEAVRLFALYQPIPVKSDKL